MKTVDEMNPHEMTAREAREAWVAALRSGKYKQGKEVLHNVTDGSHCCLGVACEVFIEHGGRLHRKEEPDGHGRTITWFHDGGSQAFQYLPPVVSDWLGGIRWEGQLIEPVSVNGHTATSLVSLNDSGSATFEDIADAIEAGKVVTSR